ncbi:DNA-binding transcriptional LysR family regulator [Oceanisphaera litoralis]|uniref:LysR family transcriptional regulator n=1 Tax=Oceanisphaera litoralis TaxID=225144 RepID=UPI00195DE7A5|nr:LysR family transcriptional regulator [Oceanisphaera litoralis]MBM7457008.1 DNA-binding transcriptional LysR family regulator [Oceanisphaera litoralis]
MLETKWLRQFAAVVREGNITRAAERLHLAQPAVTMTIKKLEQQLGTVLFDRRQGRLQLTAEGERLHQHAERILHALTLAEQDMAALHDLNSGEVCIGIPSMLGSFYFPPLLMAFKHRYPGLSIRVIEAGTQDLLARLCQGRLGLGIVLTSSLPPGLTGLPLLREEMVAVVNGDHPARQQASIAIDDFLGQELAVFRHGFFHREYIDEMARQTGIRPHIGFESNLIPLLKAVVRQGFAITTFLRRVIRDDADLFPVSFAEPYFLDLCLAWPNDRRLSRAEQAFIDFIRTEHHLFTARREDVIT